MPLCRRVQPELLDHLPPDNPAALRSRADLRRLNVLLGNFRWFAAGLAGPLRALPPPSIVEIGAGDGSLGRCLFRRCPGLVYTGLDLVPPPPDWPRELGWEQGDVFEALPRLAPTIVIANHFLHHFETPDLRRLGAIVTASKVQLLLANEPARSRYTQALALFAPLLGFNHVTLSDMRTSITAGFQGDELAGALFPADARGAWNIHCFASPAGACRLIARRHPSRIGEYFRALPE